MFCIFNENFFISIEDRLIAFGVAEILALQLAGLLLARLPVRRVLFSLAAVFTVIILLTRALSTGTSKFSTFLLFCFKISFTYILNCNPI